MKESLNYYKLLKYHANIGAKRQAWQQRFMQIEDEIRRREVEEMVRLLQGHRGYGRIAITLLYKSGVLRLQIQCGLYLN